MPHDSEARYSKKHSLAWVSYKVHVAEICDPNSPLWSAKKLSRETIKKLGVTPPGALPHTSAGTPIRVPDSRFSLGFVISLPRTAKQSGDLQAHPEHLPKALDVLCEPWHELARLVRPNLSHMDRLLFPDLSHGNELGI